MVDEWLASKPETAAVDRVLALQSATTSSLDSYAATLDDDERSRLWLSMEARDVSLEQLRAVGRHGVTESVVAVMAPRILNGSSHEERHQETARFTTATPCDGDARRSSADLVHKLLAGRAGDAALAADVAINCEGVPRNYGTRTREAFDNAVSENSRRIPQEAQKRLIGLKLLTPPKKQKKGLRSIFG
jgi:hypothetical protein